MTHEEQIEEILIEAHAHGLRIEVMEWARKEMEENPQMRRVDAYELAYREWVK